MDSVSDEAGWSKIGAMRADVSKILDDALKLPPELRANLADLLLESVEAGDPAESVAQEWKAEIERRMKELDSGSVKVVPWAEARRRIFGPDFE
jgi:putative addiction module component (TIGR02574 family)